MMKKISTGHHTFPSMCHNFSLYLAFYRQSLSIRNKIIGQNQFVQAKFRIRLRKCTFLVDCYSSSIAGSLLVNGCVVGGYLVSGYFWLVDYKIKLLVPLESVR